MTWMLHCGKIETRERPIFSIFREGEAVPDLWASLWAEQLALKMRPNSIRNYLQDLKIFYTWLDSEGIAINDRVESGGRLSPKELQRLFKTLQGRISNPAVKVSPSTYNRRIEALRAFIHFVWGRVVDADVSGGYKVGKIERLLEYFDVFFNAERPSVGEIDNASNYTQPLSPSARDSLFDLVSTRSGNSNTRTAFLEIRNEALLRLIYEGWLRRAEAVLLRVSDIELDGPPQVTIATEPGQLVSDRDDGAAIKTLGRTLPLSEQLAKLLNEYLRKYRPQIGPRSDALFLNPNDGLRLSVGSINNIFSKFRRRLNWEKLTPHMLRATAATDLKRKLSTELVNVSALQRDAIIQDTMCYCGGWSQKSKMPRRYAFEVARELIRQNQSSSYQSSTL